MSSQVFKLRPFSPEIFPDLELSGAVHRELDLLSVSFEMRGKISEVDFQFHPSGPQRRKDLLWEKTCFEIFVAAPSDVAYSEWNFSPNGDWNYFQFDDYRKLKNAVSPDIAPPQIQSRLLAPDLVLLSVEARIPELRYLETIECGISVVLSSKNNEKRAFFAIDHLSHQPDFHHRASFKLKL